MILVRTRKNFAEEMVRALKVREIPVAGADRMILTDQLVIMDLMALGNAVLLPEDDLNLAGVLKSPLIGLDEDQLYELAFGRAGTLWKALADQGGKGADYARAHEKLSRLRERADFTPPYEFFATMLGPDGGRRTLLQRLGPDAGDPMDEFLALALQFERTHTPSLQGFLHWMAAGGTQIKRDLEHGRREVRVMTVHGSKGLQAPVVFLPDTCTTPGGGKGPKLLWQGEDTVLWPVVRANEGELCQRLRTRAEDRAMAEYRRLLYVAMTRAEDRLYVCGWENKKGRAQGCWYDLVAGPLREKVREKAREKAKEQGEGITTEEGETLWRLSSEQTAPPKESQAAPMGPPPPPLPAWAAAPPPPEPKPVRPLAPSRPAGDEPAVASPLADGGAARFRRGRLIHRLLESLPDLPPGIRPAAMRDYLSRAAPDLDPRVRAQMAAETLAVLENPQFAPIFGPGSRAEVSLIGEISDRVISAQVDRLLVTDDTVTVIDYKTNRPPPESAEKAPAAYLSQMAAYRAALARIYPEKAIKCVLLWTDGPQAMVLPDALLDRVAP